MQTRAVTVPTEISIPPVIMTRLSAHESTISDAFSLRTLKKVCGFLKPDPRNMTAQRYMAANTAIVITRRRFVSDRGLFFASTVSFLFLRKFI